MAGPRIPGYERLSQIGKGGFSRVYRGEQTKLKRSVAIKVLNFGLNDEADRRSFERECELMGRVSTHPNIVTVHDTEFTTDGQPCIVMEHYPGGSLADLIGEVRQLNPKEVLEVGVAIAAALEASHQAGVLHCDLKPQNILISEFGQPALGDFGISTFTEERTRTGSDAGAGFTLAYAAPEIIEGASPSVESDLYSLAATMYTSLAGRRPFYYPGPTGDKPTAAEQARRILLEDPLPLTEDGVPIELDQLIRAAMAKDPEVRPSSAARFAASLYEIGQRLGYGTSRPPIADQGALPVFEPVTDFTDPYAGQPGVASAQQPAPESFDSPDQRTELRANADHFAAIPVVQHEQDPVAPATASAALRDPTEAQPDRIEAVVDTNTAIDLTEARDPTEMRYPGVVDRVPELVAHSTREAVASPPLQAARQGPRSRNLLATLIGLVSLLVVGGVIYVISQGDDDAAPAVAATPNSASSTSASNVVLAPPAPRSVTVSRVGTSSALVAWSHQAADDVTYEVRRTDDLRSVWGDVDASPVLLHGIDIDDVPCVEVTAVRGNLLVPSSSRACVPALGPRYIDATPANCELPCQVLVELTGFTTNEVEDVLVTTIDGELIEGMPEDQLRFTGPNTIVLNFSTQLASDVYLVRVLTDSADGSYLASVSFAADAP